MADRAIRGRVKPVIHRRRQPQGHVVALLPRSAVTPRTEQILQAVGHPLGLKDHTPLDPAGGADDCVARATQHMLGWIEHTRPGLELPCEAVMQTFEPALAGIAQIEVGEEPPHANHEPREKRTLYLAEPSDQAGRERSGNVIGQYEIELIAASNSLEHGAIHRCVMLKVKHLACPFDDNGACPP